MNLNYHKMKFLRLAFYVLIAQLVLSGCAGEAVEETSSSSASEINFDAYVGRNASTRSGVTNITFLQDTLFNSGFGVFARYNYNGKILSLLDTEHVTWNKDQNHWEYTNTRFWPSNGTVDFYAFAPYNQYVKMGSLPPYLAWQDKKISPDTYIDFPSNTSPIDLIWANQTRQKAPTSPDSKVTFKFEHALARLSFDITAPELEDGTVIKVQRVRLYGASDYEGVFVMRGYLNLYTGDWILADNGVKWHYAWTPEGKKADIPNNDKKDSIVYKLSAPPQLPNQNNKVTNDDDSYIFIIPQTMDKPFYLTITYTVEQGIFKETVTVKKNLLEVLDKSGAPNPSFTFEKGKAYVFHLILSLDPVDFSVTVDGKKRDEVTDEITI